MNAIDFNQLYDSLKSGVETVAKESLNSYVSQATKDGKNALQDIKTNLQRWAVEVETGALTKEDLQFLLQEETALDELTSLKEAGLAAVQIDKFRNGLINMIISTVTGSVKV
ncbi:hypothetical protein FEM33_17265 [Dyadobacter flavalbus]|uniref:Uncharacterized protein n=1 Tax=Dyadobacter flavalbus TaxID=2579942 RepID=A0A5M8QUX2_9BACT|nr:hypothetical protein [Dyadobacter flavalbus]KAA6438436.1 hypothetical protein FEM33_17265 [Dyadobacter flavalbus]